MDFRRCRTCNCEFEVTAGDLDFYRRVSPSFAGTIYSIPPPQLCPECRLQRRSAYRNEFQYYPGKCDRCGKSVITVYASPAPCPVYCHSCWWGEAWNPLDYGLEYDPSRPFFEQFHELQQRVPQPAMMNDNGVASENCEYTQDFSFGKNCYLCTAMWQCQDCLYCTQCNHVRDIVDSLSVSLQSELVYESCFSYRLYACAYLSACADCRNCFIGMDLKGCSDCFCCVGLRQKRYCCFNQQLTKEDYERQIASWNCRSYSGLQKAIAAFKVFAAQFPKRAVRQVNCENCSGDNLFNCREFHGSDMINAEHCRYVYHGDHPVHCYDLINTGNPQWSYEGITPDNSYQACFTLWCWKDRFVYYCDNCHSSENLFGCAGLRRETCCILNRQYSKEAYEQLAGRIASDMSARGEWGEYFPMRLSPFAYNESNAQQVRELDRTEIEKLGLRYRELAPRSQRSTAVELPDDISEADDGILNNVLTCTGCPRNFRITKLELAFYRKMFLPLPRQCPECRRLRRLREHPTSTRLYERNCSSCGKQTQTVHSTGEAIICEQCYLEKLY